MLKFLYGIHVETDAQNSTLELLLCATYYQVQRNESRILLSKFWIIGFGIDIFDFGKKMLK